MSRFMADYRITRPSSSSSTPLLAKLLFFFHADIQISGRVAFYARIRTIPTFVFYPLSLAMKRQSRHRTLTLSACEMISAAPIWKRAQMCARNRLLNWCSWILEHYCVCPKVCNYVADFCTTKCALILNLNKCSYVNNTQLIYRLDQPLHLKCAIKLIMEYNIVLNLLHSV